MSSQGLQHKPRDELQARVEGGRRQQDWFSRGDRALSAGSCFPFLSSLPVPRGPGASAAPERFLQPGIPRWPGIIGRAAANPASSAATLTPCGGLGHRRFLEIVTGECLRDVNCGTFPRGSYLAVGKFKH